MTISFKTFTSAAGLSINASPARNYMTDEDGTSSVSRQWFLDASKGPVNTDISGGVPVIAPSVARPYLDDPWTGGGYSLGGSLTGPSRTPVGGKEVVVQATTNGRGYLAFEDSPDGTVWTLQGGTLLRSGVTYGFRVIPLAAQWRVKYYDDNSHGSKNVAVFSQFRDPGV